MKRKEQYADEIIEMLERTKCGAWASNINLNTKDRVIEVCQNCVDSWSGRKFKDHCTTPPQALEQTRWIPVTERLPEEREWMGTKRFGTTISDEVYVTLETPDGERFTKHLSFQNGGLSQTDQERMRVWFKGAVPIAWMPLPEPYKEVSE